MRVRVVVEVLGIAVVIAAAVVVLTVALRGDAAAAPSGVDRWHEVRLPEPRAGGDTHEAWWACQTFGSTSYRVLVTRTLGTSEDGYTETSEAVTMALDSECAR